MIVGDMPLLGKNGNLNKCVMEGQECSSCEYQKVCNLSGKKHKFHASGIVLNGIKFPSEIEGARYEQLLQLYHAGQISNLRLQVEFVINQKYVNAFSGEKMGRICYVADFMYTDMQSGVTVVEDTKGFETAVFKAKWRQVKEMYPQYDFRILKKEDV